MNDPAEIPEEFRPIANEISAEEFEKLKALQKVMLWSTENGIPCTGRPDEIECPNPPFTLIILHGSAFALACIDCANAVIAAIMKAGNGSCRQAPLTESTPENLKRFALHRRGVNKAAGKFLVPEGKYKR